MMKIRSLPNFLTKLRTSLILLAVLLAACAPAATGTSTDSPAATQAPAVIAPTLTAAPPTVEAATEPAPTQEATALPMATSRGPDLHATDPTTVSLASGGLQFVEFFRFT
jgi:hypothetical protein